MTAIWIAISFAIGFCFAGVIFNWRESKKKSYDCVLYRFGNELYLVPDDNPMKYKEGELVVCVVKDIKQREKR